MFVLISIFLLLFVPLLMLILRLVRPGFAYHWLVAATGALVAWPLILLAGLRLPQVIPLFSYHPDVLFSSWSILLVDRLSWPYAMSLATMILSIIFTDVMRASETDWAVWAGSLTLAALGLIAVLAGTPFTMLLAWTAIDLVELLILLSQVNQGFVRARVVIAFSARVLGSGLLVAGIMASQLSGESLTFADVLPQANIFLLLAAGLRLGVLPLHMPFFKELPLRHGLGTAIRLTPAAASLALLARTAATDEPAMLAPYLLALAGVAALYSGVAWLLAADELDGLPAWILGMASLSLAAAVRGQPYASQAWGMAALLSGGLLFLASTRERWTSWLALLGLLGASVLPFSPTWNGARLYASPFDPLVLPFLFAQVLLQLGYIRHAFRLGEPLAGVERWVWMIYPLGLAIIPIMHFLYGWWAKPEIESVVMVEWFAGAASLGLVALLLVSNRYVFQFKPGKLTSLGSFFSLNWQYRLFWNSYRFLGNITAFLTTVFEGEGGILWALLLLVLLFSVFIRVAGG